MQKCRNQPMLPPAGVVPIINSLCNSNYTRNFSAELVFEEPLRSGCVLTKLINNSRTFMTQQGSELITAIFSHLETPVWSLHHLKL
jgi:hypothetical protein